MIGGNVIGDSANRIFSRLHMGLLESKAVVIYPSGEREEVTFPKDKRWGKLIGKNTYFNYKGKRIYHHPTIIREYNVTASSMVDQPIYGPILIIPATLKEIPATV